MKFQGKWVVPATKFLTRCWQENIFSRWLPLSTYFLNCFRKMPTFIPLLESRMLICKQEWKAASVTYWHAFRPCTICDAQGCCWFSCRQQLLLVVTLWDNEIHWVTCTTSLLSNNRLNICPLAAEWTIFPSQKKKPNCCLLITDWRLWVSMQRVRLTTTWWEFF